MTSNQSVTPASGGLDSPRLFHMPLLLLSFWKECSRLAEGSASTQAPGQETANCAGKQPSRDTKGAVKLPPQLASTVRGSWILITITQCCVQCILTRPSSVRSTRPTPLWPINQNKCRDRGHSGEHKTRLARRSACIAQPTTPHFVTSPTRPTHLPTMRLTYLTIVVALIPAAFAAVIAPRDVG